MIRLLTPEESTLLVQTEINSPRPWALFVKSPQGISVLRDFHAETLKTLANLYVVDEVLLVDVQSQTVEWEKSQVVLCDDVKCYDCATIKRDLVSYHIGVDREILLCARCITQREKSTHTIPPPYISY